MNLERMKRLIQYLAKYEEVKPKGYRFDMCTFGSPCGTAACAIGHCPFIFPENKDWKLRSGFGPTYQGVGEFQAGADFFEIDYETCSELFEVRTDEDTGCEIDETSQEVAARLNEWFMDETGESAL